MNPPRQRKTVLATDIERLENTSVTGLILGVEAAVLGGPAAPIGPTDGCAPCGWLNNCVNSDPWDKFTFVVPPEPKLCTIAWTLPPP